MNNNKVKITTTLSGYELKSRIEIVGTNGSIVIESPKEDVLGHLEYLKKMMELKIKTYIKKRNEE